MKKEIIVGIDLGTTNSEISAYIDGRIQVIGDGKSKMLASCVGITPSGKLLVGEAARNQQLIYPERTIRSIKRKMGSNKPIQLADRTFSPQEISALILRELIRIAEETLKQSICKAVITVPAYFSDAQRQATREAGKLAGLEVLRIINEPTAASLAYGTGKNDKQNLLVFDLGGGTFDVSVIHIEGNVTEVLASNGNNHLGGDDFTQKLVDHLVSVFQDKHKIDLSSGHSAAYSRLWWAAEEAKKELSANPFARIREENLAKKMMRPLHLELEISLDEYNEMILPMVESTLDCVLKAMEDAGVTPATLDTILLVGGSTRNSLVTDMLEERFELTPKQEVHPDLCVALGAGLMASRLSGIDLDKILVDISPYSFGVSHMGEMDGMPYAHCYHPIIKKNTALPITRTKSYWTMYPMQEKVEVNIYQGNSRDALKNIPIGNFMIEELTPCEEINEILCTMMLDLNGILKVTATEKVTGKSKHVTIDQALKPKTEAEILEAKAKISQLFDQRIEVESDILSQGGDPIENEHLVIDHAPQIEEDKDYDTIEPHSSEGKEIIEAEALIDRSRVLLKSMHDDDQLEAIDLHEKIFRAINTQQLEKLKESVEELTELLFFVEGK